MVASIPKISSYLQETQQVGGLRCVRRLPRRVPHRTSKRRTRAQSPVLHRSGEEATPIDLLPQVEACLLIQSVNPLEHHEAERVLTDLIPECANEVEVQLDHGPYRRSNCRRSAIRHEIGGVSEERDGAKRRTVPLGTSNMWNRRVSTSCDHNKSHPILPPRAGESGLIDIELRLAQASCRNSTRWIRNLLNGALRCDPCGDSCLKCLVYSLGELIDQELVDQ